MRLLVLMLALLPIAGCVQPSLSFPMPPSGRPLAYWPQTGRVVRVVDSDTFEIELYGSLQPLESEGVYMVDLLGVRVEPEGSSAAIAWLRENVEGRAVVVQKDPYSHLISEDGHLLRRVFVGDRMSEEFPFPLYTEELSRVLLQRGWLAEADDRLEPVGE